MSRNESKMPSEDRIERLLRFAGPRPEVPEGRSERVHDQVREVWRAGLRRRARRRWTLTWTALAAAAALTGIALFPGLGERLATYAEPVPQGPVARVESVTGAVRFAARHGQESERGRLVMVGDVLRAGAALESADPGRMALRLASGPSVRMDVNSAVRLLSGEVIGLDRGSVYVDSGTSQATVEIQTPTGKVLDVGTQFEVRLRPQGVRVRVRDGLIHLERSGESFEATAGTELEVDSAGTVSRRSVPTYGPMWEWVLETAPPFQLEGSNLGDFLAWVDQETGWGLRFADRRTELSAPYVVLHGSLDGIRPDRALDAVLPTCGLTHELDSGTLHIEPLPQ
jgi:ferric-dicitrate binding protein FerR (iron transport regulator)